MDILDLGKDIFSLRIDNSNSWSLHFKSLSSDFKPWGRVLSLEMHILTVKVISQKIKLNLWRRKVKA